jgi:tRNA1Val (adenine37-N6)-methyltransferase
MSHSYFRFKQFTISQARTSMKVTTDSCLFGAWVARQANKESKNLLDIGTGTALLSLMIAQETNCLIDAIEIESSAAEEAKDNVKASPWNERIHIIEGDVTSLPLKKYDCIVSNPPFYENDLKAPSEGKNIAHHSQDLTLEELVKIIGDGLNDAGEFFLLLPFRRKSEILEMIESAGLFVWEMVRVCHSSNHPPMRIMIRGGCEKRLFAETDIFINDISGNYSSEFVDLLKDYYL